MIEKNDWRLQGQEKYLKGVSLTFKPYSNFREEWDHDHCSFCNMKFMDKDHPQTLHEGYATDDNYHWVCAQCFNDFKDLFEWKVAS